VSIFAMHFQHIPYCGPVALNKNAVESCIYLLSIYMLAIWISQCLFVRCATQIDTSY